MHVRFTTCVGMAVTDIRQEEDIGAIRSILIHPDTGAIAGFFVDVSGGFWQEPLLLLSADIVHFGTRVRIRDASVLSPPHELVRLQPLLDDRRTVLYQRVVTESGRVIGMCRDVQFETETFCMEWLFPRRWLRWQPAIPRSAIVKVRPDAIVIRDPATPEKVPAAEALFKTLEPLGGTPVSYVAEKM